METIEQTPQEPEKPPIDAYLDDVVAHGFAVSLAGRLQAFCRGAMCGIGAIVVGFIAWLLWQFTASFTGIWVAFGVGLIFTGLACLVAVQLTLYALMGFAVCLAGREPIAARNARERF